MVERLYELQGGSGSAAHIGTVWFVEAPNHGDSAILNKDVLRNHFSTNCTDAFHLFSIITHPTPTFQFRSSITAKGSWCS